MEEAQGRGRVWFWSQVVRTAGALYSKGFARSPLAILGLAVSGGAAWFLFTLIMVGVELIITPPPFFITAPLRALGFLGLPFNLRAVHILLLGALLTGMILGRAAPLRGMYASVCLAFVSVPGLWLILIGANPPAGSADARPAALASAVVLLLLGSAYSRLRAAGQRS